ncbi:uncharacterized protein M6B38_188835 [Iris pallida]|uniref:ELMO domain-containing protein n=1 Tax=Iris pallida TaxID=29817 RepID=A0AAX6EI05_IRIPA|nr:uncharacterized protein M6B38_188835 [Iris pallida]
MTIKAIRRRLRHGNESDAEGKYERMETSRSDSLSEPLLGEHRYHESHSEELHSDLLDARGEKKREPVCWTHLFSHLFTQCAQWIANIFSGSRALLGRLFSLPSTTQSKQEDAKAPIFHSPLQEERFMRLKQRLEIPFDGFRLDHQDALKQLWRLAYPQREVPPLKSEAWKEMGWQGSDPSTDFRSAGFISLENLIFFAKNYPGSFQRLLHKQDGKRSDWEYPFAAAGVNISFMLTQMLGLNPGTSISKAGTRFVEFLGSDEMAFDNLYCIAFQMLDSKWVSMHASYMEFNVVLKSTRAQLEHELGLKDVFRIDDLPAYSMLHR